MNKRMKRYVLSGLVTAIVIVLSVLPFSDMPDLSNIPFWDKWVHFVMYGGLCSVYWFDYFRNGNKRNEWRKWLLWIVALPIALGGLLELAQKYLTTYRSGDWMDFLANSLGVLLAIPLGLFVINLLADKTKTV